MKKNGRAVGLGLCDPLSMVNQAVDLEADAVVNMRFMTSMIMQGASEMLAYGTAVKTR